MFILAHKSLTVEEQPRFVTDCEINWIKVKLKNSKDLYFGAYYLPQRNEYDIVEPEKSLSMLTKNGIKDTHIILAGDFNCPQVNWEYNTVAPGADDRALQEKLVAVTAAASLTQTHFAPTRYSNTLDLLFTTNRTLLKNSTSIPGKSDDDAVVSDFDTKPHISIEKQRLSYKSNKADWNEINKDFQELLPEIEKEYEDGKDTSRLWLTFKTRLMERINKHIPQHTSKKRFRLPWMNRSLLKRP